MRILKTLILRNGECSLTNIGETIFSQHTNLMNRHGARLVKLPSARSDQLGLVQPVMGTDGLHYLPEFRSQGPGIGYPGMSFVLFNRMSRAIVLRNYHRWSLRMEAVKISPKFQVVIPKKLRKALKLSPGQKVQMIVYDNRIEMIPLRNISEMKGFLKGIDTTVEREPDRI